MAVMLAGVELPGTQTIRTEEERAVVEHQVPGLEGSVLQDLGRDAAVTIIEGIFHGEKALEELEKQREHFKAGKPVPFTADITTGTDIADVLIQDFRVWQAAGYKSRYRYLLRLCEYIEPPAPQFAKLEPVNAGIAVDAAAWSSDVMAAGEALRNALLLPDLLKSQPGLLDQLSVGDLGAAIDKIGDLAQGDLMGIVEILGCYDVGKLAGLLTEQADLLGCLDIGGLGSLLTEHIGDLASGDFTNILSALGGLDVNKFAGLLTGQADLLGCLDIGDLGSLLTEHIGDLASGDFTNILSALGGVDVNKFAGLLTGQVDLLGCLDIGDLGSLLSERIGDLASGDFTGILSALGGQGIGKLAGLLTGQTDLLDHLNMGDLGGILTKNAEAFIGGDFRKILNALGDKDLTLLKDLVGSLSKEDLDAIVGKTMDVEIVDENGEPVKDVTVKFIDEYGVEWNAENVPPGKYTVVVDNIPPGEDQSSDAPST